MLLTVFGPILLILVTFLPSFLEAGALFGAALSGERHGGPNSEHNEGKGKAVASAGAVVAAMIIFRVQLAIALSVWIAENLYNDKETSLMLLSTVVTSAFLLGEVIGKLVALRFPAHARRAVQPLRRLLARIKPLWFNYG